MLTIVTQPGTEDWSMSDEHASLVAKNIVGTQPVRLEYWPRARAGQAWSRDRNRHPEVLTAEGYWYDPEHPYNLRGYSFTTPTRGMVAVVFCDHREDYESATFVALHELAHLLVEERDDDEIHADLIASAMMPELGYAEGVREAGPP